MAQTADLDARGLSCPEPVLMVQRAVAAGDPARLTVLVDNICAVENITRFAEHTGRKAAAVQDGDEYTLTLTK